MLFCCLVFSPSLNKAFLASSLANLVLANMSSPKPLIPTGFPSDLLASGLKLSILSVKLSIALSDSALVVVLLLT